MIDESLNFNEYSQSNDITDFSDFNTEEIINRLVTIWNSELQSHVGKDGLIKVNSTLSNNLIENTFIFASSIDINEVGDLNDLKYEIVRDMTATQDDLDTWDALYNLDIEVFKFNFKN